MKTRLYGACYYCICTACSRSSCPFKHLEFQCCYACHQRRDKRPRLDCDFFRHYIKTKVFRFRAADRSGDRHRGTFILISERSVFVGSYEKLERLRARFGGDLKRIHYLDFIGGVDYDKH